MKVREESLVVDGPVGRIEALIERPAEASSPPCGVAVIAHPHPLFGGTMHNKVVHTLARALVQSGWTAVRFNFRGVGASEGAHDEGHGEVDDLLAVVRQAAPEGPLALAGFSFGTAVVSNALTRLWPMRDIAKIVLVGTAVSRFSVARFPAELADRILVLHGERDETVPLAQVFAWARDQGLLVSVVPGGEHFFHGQLPLLKSAVNRHLRC